MASSGYVSTVDEEANSVSVLLEKVSMRAGYLNTIVVRCSQNDDVVSALFVKLSEFPKPDLPKRLKGLRVYYY